MPSTKYLSELPPTLSGRYERKPDPEHMKLAKAAQRKPGKWIKAREFKYAQSASRWAAKIRNNVFLAFREGLYEASVRDRVVYIRYLDSDGG